MTQKIARFIKESREISNTISIEEFHNNATIALPKALKALEIAIERLDQVGGSITVQHKKNMEALEQIESILEDK